MHLVDTSVGHMGSSSIVGGGIPIGTGLALASMMKGENRVSVVFFGDGAADEGVLYESVNFAVLKRLPVIYIYENNQYSVCSHVSRRQWGNVVFHYVPANKMASAIVDGNDVLAVYKATVKAVRRARKGLGPSFIECRTYRLRGHAGTGSDEKLGYRSAEEIKKWEKKCPIRRFKARLLKDRVITRSDIEIMEKKINEEIDEAFRFAQESPLPREEDLELYLLKE